MSAFKPTCVLLVRKCFKYVSVDWPEIALSSTLGHVFVFLTFTANIPATCCFTEQRLSYNVHECVSFVNIYCFYGLFLFCCDVSTPVSAFVCVSAIYP